MEMGRDVNMIQGGRVELW